MFLSMGLLSACVQQPGQDQAIAESQELTQDSCVGGRDPAI